MKAKYPFHSLSIKAKREIRVKIGCDTYINVPSNLNSAKGYCKMPDHLTEEKLLSIINESGSMAKAAIVFNVEVKTISRWLKFLGEVTKETKRQLFNCDLNSEWYEDSGKNKGLNKLHYRASRFNAINIYEFNTLSKKTTKELVELFDFKGGKLWIPKRSLRNRRIDEIPDQCEIIANYKVYRRWHLVAKHYGVSYSALWAWRKLKRISDNSIETKDAICEG